MSKRRLAIIVGCLTGVAIIPIALVAVANFAEWPGGMRPDYLALDGDARLTREARTASPIIDALRKFHAEHSEYPAALAEVRSLLPNATVDSGPFPFGWHYDALPNSEGYVLSRKLGWDPSLRYESSGAGGSWIFSPGDGSPERPLFLNP